LVELFVETGDDTSAIDPRGATSSATGRRVEERLVRASLLIDQLDVPADVSMGHVDRTCGQRASLGSRRRHLQITLGLIWLLDAALQFQPYMFSRSFVVHVLEPAATGTPAVVGQPMLWADHFMAHDIGPWNALFATVQLVIALGLFWRPTVRVALAASIAWSIGVWWIGEGLGGVLSGATPVAGYPGAVILYALLAVLVWPSVRRPARRSVAESGPLGRRVAELLWVVLWGSFAYFQLLPANRTPQGLRNMVAAMAPGEPSWIRSLDHGLAVGLSHHGSELSVLVAVACIVVALGVLVPATVRPTVGLAVVISLAIWVTQDFGGIFTGTGTDVNSGLLLLMVALAYWPMGVAGATCPAAVHGPAHAWEPSGKKAATPHR
jgi:hypothetical protein